MAQIVVLSTKTQKKYTVTCDDLTLGGLKSVLSTNGIDYSGMTFFEGRTKTELLADDSTFPENAVVRLTKAEKKITSGAEFTTRQDCKEYLQTHPSLASEIKAKEGKNWTNVQTIVLLQYCNKDANISSPVTKVEVKVETPSSVCECHKGSMSKEDWISLGAKLGYVDENVKLALNGVRVEEISQSEDDMFDFCEQ